MVDETGFTFLGNIFNDILSLLFCAYDQDILSFLGNLLDEIQGILKDRYRLLKVDDINAVPLPEDIVGRFETAELVRTTLTKIPDRYRQVLRQYYYQQKSIREISNVAGKSAAALRILLFRARKAFKNQLLKTAKSFDQTDLG